jgi:hypothetical protein
MNPPPLPAPPPDRGRPRSPFGKILAGILIGVAPMVISLLVVAAVSKSSQVDAVILGLFAGAAVCSIIGGALVGWSATARTGPRIVIALAVAAGLFALDVTGGIFFGCFIVMGKGI